VALRNRSLVKPAHCQARGCTRQHRLEAHHEDYERPFEVEWFCPRCHPGRGRGLNLEKFRALEDGHSRNISVRTLDELCRALRINPDGLVEPDPSTDG
jgi:hypothetical protein